MKKRFLKSISFLILGMLLLVLSSCHSKESIYVIGEPYEQYIGKTQDEVIKMLEQEKIAILGTDDTGICIKETIYDKTFIVNLSFDSKSHMMYGFCKSWKTESPVEEGFAEIQKQIFEAYSTKYGEPLQEQLTFEYKEIWGKLASWAHKGESFDYESRRVDSQFVMELRYITK